MDTKILIVEDEGLIALDLKKRLELAGYTVPAIADNAADALLEVERLDPSMVLMDIRLRGTEDGIQTADRIRRRFDIPVMFVTAHADRETLERAKITEPLGTSSSRSRVDFRAQIEMALWKHKMEHKLRVSEAWLSTTVQNVADALITTDSEGAICFMNTRAADLTGWDCEAARGKPLLNVFGIAELTGAPVVHPFEAIYDGRDIGTESLTFALTKADGSSSVMVDAEFTANRGSRLAARNDRGFSGYYGAAKGRGADRRLNKMNALAVMATGLGGN